MFGFVCFFYTEEDANEYARILDRDTIENIQIAGLKYYKKGKKVTAFSWKAHSMVI